MMRSAAVPHGRVDGRRKSLPISPVYTVTGFPSLMQRGVAELFSHAMFRTHGTRSPAPAGHGAGSVERPGRVEVPTARGRGKFVFPPTIPFVVVRCNHLVRLSHRTWRGNFA